jgi:hypothetical protein
LSNQRNYLEDKRITPIAKRHRHQEWVSFLKKIDQETPKDVSIHLIADYDSTHQHAKVKTWLTRHPKARQDLLDIISFVAKHNLRYSDNLRLVSLAVSFAATIAHRFSSSQDMP